MKKRMIIFALLAVGMALLFSTTSVLAVKPQPVGERLNLSEGPGEFPANTPFHITHGFASLYYITEPIGNGFALSKMTLELDGVEVEPTYIESTWLAEPKDYLDYDVPVPFKGFVKLFTFNFPDGLDPGEATFVRKYYFTCQSYLKGGFVLTCEHPTLLIEEPGMAQTLVLDFTE